MLVTHAHRVDIVNVVAAVSACYLVVNLIKLACVVWLFQGRPPR